MSDAPRGTPHVSAEGTSVNKTWCLLLEINSKVVSAANGLPYFLL